MKLNPIGRVDDPAELDLDPIVVPVVGYTADRQEVIENFKFRPVQAAGAALDILRQTDGEGRVPLGPVMRFLDKCLMPEDTEAFHAFLDRDDVFIEQTVLVEIYQAISEVYAGRPTLLTSGSDGGGSTTKRTSQAGARARASAAKKNQ